jgi:hypothetical protein
MDLIFRQKTAVFVFANPELTQRTRPQAYIEAERRRIEVVLDSEGSGVRALHGVAQA